METGRLGEWLKRDGERVEAGELLFTVEGDKATQEVEALDSGILRIPPDSPPPGKEVPVGTLLGYLLAPGEETQTARSCESAKLTANRSSGIRRSAASSNTAASDQLPVQRNSRQPSARARRVASELGVDWTGLTGSGRTGRIVERDVRQAAAAAVSRQPSAVSPLAQAPGGRAGRGRGRIGRPAARQAHRARRY